MATTSESVAGCLPFSIFEIFKVGGMWWGTAIEAPDPGALARFYLELLDWPIAHDEARNSRFWLCRDDG